MSGKMTGWVLDHGPDDPALTLVLIALADAANNDGSNIRLSEVTIARRARMSQWTARKLLDRAKAEGWIEVAQPGRAHRSAVYQFVPALLKAAAVDNPDRTYVLRARRAHTSAAPGRDSADVGVSASRKSSANGFDGITGLGSQTEREGRNGSRAVDSPVIGGPAPGESWGEYRERGGR